MTKECYLQDWYLFTAKLDILFLFCQIKRARYRDPNKNS